MTLEKKCYLKTSLKTSSTIHVASQHSGRAPPSSTTISTRLPLPLLRFLQVSWGSSVTVWLVHFYKMMTTIYALCRPWNNLTAHKNIKNGRRKKLQKRIKKGFIFRALGGPPIRWGASGSITFIYHVPSWGIIFSRTEQASQDWKCSTFRLFLCTYLLFFFYSIVFLQLDL